MGILFIRYRFVFNIHDYIIVFTFIHTIERLFTPVNIYFQNQQVFKLCLGQKFVFKYFETVNSWHLFLLTDKNPAAFLKPIDILAV